MSQSLVRTHKFKIDSDSWRRCEWKWFRYQSGSCCWLVFKLILEEQVDAFDFTVSFFLPGGMTPSSLSLSLSDDPLLIERPPGKSINRRYISNQPAASCRSCSRGSEHRGKPNWRFSFSFLKRNHWKVTPPFYIQCKSTECKKVKIVLNFFDPFPCVILQMLDKASCDWNAYWRGTTWWNSSVFHRWRTHLGSL